MKLSNAIKKLSKHTEVKHLGNGIYSGVIGSYTVEFMQNGGGDEITCVSTCRLNDRPDSMTDYFPQIWHENLTQAINFVKMG